MSDEEINIAIAELSGLTKFKPLQYVTRRGTLLERGVKGVRLMYCAGGKGGWQDWEDVPNYCGCLNAMRLVLELVPKSRRLQYRRNLNLTTNGLTPGKLRKLTREQQDQAYWNYVTATAKQHAVAFVMTMGRWE